MSTDLVRVLNDKAGLALELVGTIDRGQSGAAHVRWPDGRESVVTTAFASMELMRQTADVLDGVRALGIPVPRHEFLFEVEPGMVAVVQERLPGTMVDRVEIDTVEAVMAANEGFAGLLRERPDVRAPALSLGRSGDPTPYDAVQAHDARSRALVSLVQASGGNRADDMVGDDLVHVDLTVSNMLFDDSGAITGVVDWNYGVARGDRQFGLVKLLHTLSFAARTPGADIRPTPAALDRVERGVSNVLPVLTFRRYWAHQTMNMLYASLRWGTPQAFATYLELGESQLAT
jgi:aminoglycoside phosphotransferase (APT) family kinase protein